mmetsp:Transcript_37588/g.56751  ORF Transcript_37588/g.56751 Transcript_37588/m.56751 type:complete len:216 (-) Transcript_37588:126-773(-)
MLQQQQPQQEMGILGGSPCAVHAHTRPTHRSRSVVELAYWIMYSQGKGTPTSSSAGIDVASTCTNTLCTARGKGQTVNVESRRLAQAAKVFFVFARSLTAADTALNSGVSLSLINSNMTLSDVVMTAPAASNRARANEASSGRCELTASAAMWTSKPRSSRSIVVCCTQTWASTPKMTALFLFVAKMASRTSGVHIENRVFAKTWAFVTSKSFTV